MFKGVLSATFLLVTLKSTIATVLISSNADEIEYREHLT